MMLNKQIVTVCLCVYTMVTTVSPAKMAEPIDMPFGSRKPRSHVLWMYVWMPHGKYD